MKPIALLLFFLLAIAVYGAERHALRNGPVTLASLRSDVMARIKADGDPAYQTLSIIEKAIEKQGGKKKLLEVQNYAKDNPKPTSYTTSGGDVPAKPDLAWALQNHFFWAHRVRDLQFEYAAAKTADADQLLAAFERRSHGHLVMDPWKNLDLALGSHGFVHTRSAKVLQVVDGGLLLALYPNWAESRNVYLGCNTTGISDGSTIGLGYFAVVDTFRYTTVLGASVTVPVIHQIPFIAVDGAVANAETAQPAK